MSHFSVMVRTQGAESVEQLLIPYQEHACTGECPREYMVFYDKEEELRQEYEAQSQTMVCCPDGILRPPWDELFRKSGSLGVGSDTHNVPCNYERINVPYKELYETFEEFVRECHGTESRDPEKERYGYWENPNKKWDWWQVGGRYSNKLGGKNTRTGYWLRVHAQAAQAEAEQCVREFLQEYQGLLDGLVEDCPFSGPRDMALRIGLIECKNADEIAPELFGNAQYKLIKWGRQLKEGTDRYDVQMVVTDIEAFVAEWACVFHPWRTYARLDSSGWVEPGKMGWFGMSDDTPETLREYSQNFLQWLAGAADSDVFTVLDCHI